MVLLWVALVLYLIASLWLWIFFLELVKRDQRKFYDLERGEMLVEIYEHQWRFFFAWLVIWPGLPFIILGRKLTRRTK